MEAGGVNWDDLINPRKPEVSGARMIHLPAGGQGDADKRISEQEYQRRKRERNRKWRMKKKVLG